MKVYLSSDHAGFDLKEELKKFILENGCQVFDLGCDSSEKSCSYAVQGKMLANKILKDEKSIGVAICGTGLGMSYSVNRFKGIRGARVTSSEDAIMARKHNDANIIIFGSRQISKKEAIKLFTDFAYTEFEGGRHISRIEELDK